jgi:hypothetical protein
MLGTIDRDPLLGVIHVAALVTITVLGVIAASRTFDARLVRG